MMDTPSIKNQDTIYIYPTDTVWGIGCSIYSLSGHDKIAEIKQTDKNKPLSIMFSSVDDVMNSFDFPAKIDKEWLRAFFKLQTTLGVPRNLAKIKIPLWATGESAYVSLRCLETEAVLKIYQEIKAPFFTTSLNLTQEAPITDQALAIKFQNKYAPDAKIILTANETLSGSSSTIVFLDEELGVKIIRSGAKIQKVLSHLKKLF